MAYGNRGNAQAARGNQAPAGKTTYVPVTGLFLSKSGTTSSVKINDAVLANIKGCNVGDTLILFTEDVADSKGDFTKTHTLKRIPADS